MDKNYIFTEHTNVTHGRGDVYLLQYHIVWVTKYRKPVLVGMVAAETKRHLLETMEPVNKDRGTSGNRGSRGKPTKPALRIAQTVSGSPVQRARIRPAQKAGIRQMKQEIPLQVSRHLITSVQTISEARDFSRE